MKDTLVLHPHPFPAAQLGHSLLDSTGFLRQGIRHCVFDKKALTAGWQVRCGGGPEGRAALKGPPYPGSLWPQDGIMPLFLFRSAMVLRLWLALAALLASFFLRSWVVSRLCPWPRGLPVTAVEFSGRYLRE